MYFCLVIAILATLIWLNITFADYINVKINPYSSKERDEEDNKRAKLKTYLVIIMALFWAAVIRFS